MESISSFWQLGDELRERFKASEDHKWLMVASKLAEQARLKFERMNNIDIPKEIKETMRPMDKFGFQEDNKESLNFNMVNLDSKMVDHVNKGVIKNGIYNIDVSYQRSHLNHPCGLVRTTYNKEVNNDNISSGPNNETNSNYAGEKRFKTLPVTETLPRNEVLGGYIFVCNNDTMEEDLKRQLFGLPARYRDSVRAITPGLPLFLYNYTTHQLHGIFEAASFGGSNIDPTAWEDKKCKGESRFPAQVKTCVRKICKPLAENSFRPVLHHYDGPKFRLELSVPETLDLLDLCDQGGSP